MAIFSLNHRPIGKTTQARPNTAAAHIRYISRTKAVTHIDGRGIPTNPQAAHRYFIEAEALDRKNARVADKVMLALPKELTAKQRAALVRRYAEAVTQGRAPWYAAIHDQGKDAHNPHCHLVIRDRDPDTGKRVIGLSEKGSTSRLREAWQSHANGALEDAGQAARIDHRSLAVQGQGRRPTIHEGPRSRGMQARGARPVSRRRQVRNQPGARRGRRWVDYPKIDRGRSRPDYNRQLESPAELWQAVDADRQRRDLAALRPHQAPGLPEVAPRSLTSPARTPAPSIPAKLPSLTRALSQVPLAPVQPVATFKPPPLTLAPDELARRRGLKR